MMRAGRAQQHLLGGRRECVGGDRASARREGAESRDLGGRRDALHGFKASWCRGCRVCRLWGKPRLEVSGIGTPSEVEEVSGPVDGGIPSVGVRDSAGSLRTLGRRCLPIAVEGFAGSLLTFVASLCLFGI